MKDNNVSGPIVSYLTDTMKKKKTKIRNAEMITCRYHQTHSKMELSCKTCERDSIHDDWKATTLRNSGVVRWQSSGWNGKPTNKVSVSDMDTITQRKELELVKFKSMDYVPRHKQCFIFMVI